MCARGIMRLGCHWAQSAPTPMLSLPLHRDLRRRGTMASKLPAGMGELPSARLGMLASTSLVRLWLSHVARKRRGGKGTVGARRGGVLFVSTRAPVVPGAVTEPPPCFISALCPWHAQGFGAFFLLLWCGVDL